MKDNVKNEMFSKEDVQSAIHMVALATLGILTREEAVKKIKSLPVELAKMAVAASLAAVETKVMMDECKL